MQPERNQSSHPSHAHDQPHHRHIHADVALPASPQAAEGAQWTCPMHPEIMRNAPGDCPIWGMSLVPIAGAGAGAWEPDDSELRDLARRL